MEAILSVFAALVPSIGLRRIRRFPETPAPASSIEKQNPITRRDRRNKPPDEPGPVK